MDRKRIIVIASTVLVALIAGVCFFRGNYVLINGEIMDRDTAEVVLVAGDLPDVEKMRRMDEMKILDLRELDVTTDTYDMLRREFPECEIRWNVPFQGMNWDNAATEVAVTTMSSEHAEMLNYFPKLQIVDALACRDYDALLELRAQRPDLQVRYVVDLGDVQLRENAEACTVTNENVHNLIRALAYLPELKTVTSAGCTDYAGLVELQAARPDMELNYTVEIGGVPQSPETVKLTLNQEAAAEALELLQYLPELKEVEFVGLVSDNEQMYQLKSQYPDVTFYWEFELFGVQTNSLATELILNDIPMENTDAVEGAMKYFYQLERVEMCDCGISGEDMDALNKRYPDTRFIWMVHIGIGSLRTDAVGCIPYHLHYNLHRPFYDKEAKDLKYCTDLIALDLGHMMVTDLSFLQYMPNLKYLVLGDMELVEDFSYIANLTELVFLEIFQTKFTDVSLLMNMTKLEDLNISWTKLENPELLKEMTWLKRLWCTSIGTSQEALKELAAALPDTLVYYKSLHPTEGGWRNSQNYRDMRDTLNMFYMQ